MSYIYNIFVVFIKHVLINQIDLNKVNLQHFIDYSNILTFFYFRTLCEVGFSFFEIDKNKPSPQ